MLFLMFGLADDLQFLYNFVERRYFRDMKPDEFVVLTDRGCIGLGTFLYVPWHKKEKENILKSVNVKPEFAGEPTRKGKDKGTFMTVGDREHAQLIELYLDEKLSMQQIAQTQGRSSATLKRQIDYHNKRIARSGFCAACRRARSHLEDQVAKRQK